MKFRTEYIPNPKEENGGLLINPTLPVSLIGSCFSANIAEKMKNSLWKAVNPLGTLYNPQSIAKALRLTLLSHFPDSEFEKSLFLSGDKYRSWLFDSRFSSYCAPDSMTAFQKHRQEFLVTIVAGRLLIVTFGTSWIYKHNGETVGNCHKQPASNFERYRLSVRDIVEDWKELINQLQNRYPGLRIIFTVSPVRHLKDGFEGNSRSKAILLLATEELCLKCKDCYYFPAYEILNDDLRDYRFYASDLVHPSQEGIDYIWDKFCETFLDSSGLKKLREGEALKKALDHKPIPDASRLVPAEVLIQQEKRREELREEYEKFLKLK